MHGQNHIKFEMLSVWM